MATLEPAYLSLDPSQLQQRVEEALATLADCRACPRDCRVDRLRDEIAVCKSGRHAVVANYFAHFGEEDCLRGWNGSGTIFFSHCNLRCVFCQNYDISQAIKAKESTGAPPERIADMMLELQEHGCHNVNFVTPEHVVPQVVEAIAVAVDRGLRVPIVYNTSAYDALDSLRLMDGLVDIYMPDFKVWSVASSRRWLLAADYPETARRSIREMHRQVGTLTFSDDGLARRGLLLRHLVMPGGLDETRAILSWVAEELGPETYVNLMGQYHPAGRVSDDRYPEINRRLESGELAEARRIATELGLSRLDRRAAVQRFRMQSLPVI